MHLKLEKSCRIRHRIENIKYLGGKEHIFDEPKRNRIQAGFENSLYISNGENFTEFGTELKK